VTTLDYSQSWHYLIALLPEIVLSAWAMLVLMLDVFRKGSRSMPSSPAIPWLTLVGLALAGVANGWLLRVGEIAPTGVVAVDGFRVFVNFVLLIGAALFVLISTRYVADENLRLGELYVLIMFATVGMMVFAGGRELIVIFLGLELMSVPIYVLVGLNRRRLDSAEGALKYFLLGAFASAFFLYGIAMVYGATGTTQLAMISLAVGVDGVGASPLLLIGIAMLAVGFAFKVAAVPFHMWTPDAYEGAPAPVTGFMATAVKAAAFAAFVRVFLTAFPGMYDTWDAIAIWLAVATMVAANLIALVQGNVKRMLAYSSIAHAGYLLVALAAASVIGAASFLFYAVAYTFMTMGAFAVLIAVGRRGEERVDLDAYRGLGTIQPGLAAAMTLFLLSLAGIPLTAGFVGKLFIFRAAVEQGLVGLAIVLAIASVISYFYYLRVAWYMWFLEPVAPTRDAAPQRLVLAPGLRVAIAIAIIGVLGLGVFPGRLLEVSERSAASLLPVAPGLFGAAP
jgi:NADH-quinone oxidoreductase subunit N